MSPARSDKHKHEPTDFERARLGAGNLYFDIVHNNMENINFEDTVSILTSLSGFLEEKNKNKMKNIINELHRSEELDPDALISIFEDLSIAPKKVAPRVIRQPSRKKVVKPVRHRGSTVKKRARGGAANPVLRKGRALQRNEGIDEAIYHYKKAVSDGNRDFEVIKELAALFMITGDLDHARSYYDIVLEDDPDNFEMLSDKASR